MVKSSEYLNSSYIFKLDFSLKSDQTERHRLPAQFSSLTPDATTITPSQLPRDWHLYPTGIIYKFDAQKFPSDSSTPKNRTRSFLPNHKKNCTIS